MNPPVYQRGFKDDDLRKHGCVLASLAWVRNWAGNDRTSESMVGRYLSLSKVSTKDFRKRGIKLGEAAKAATLAYPGDRLPPVFRKVIGGSVETDLFPDILSGAVALVWVDYSIVQDAGLGIGTFRGGHGVVYAAVDGDRIVVPDPLRKNLVRWPRDVAVRAAERFGSRKRVNALVFKPSLTHVEEIARYRDLMLRARSQRDAFRAEVDILRPQVDGTALKALKDTAKNVAGELEAIADRLDGAAA